MPNERSIERGRSYRLVDFRKIAGLGRDSMRKAREKGLRVRKVGRVGFVSGDDWFDFLEKCPETTPTEGK